ncbi:MAG: heparinase II/III family protein, partial [Phycisphaerae bacterium]
MNKLTRMIWTAQALGWENLPRRVLQIAKHKLKLLEKRLPAGELSADELRAHFTPDYAPAHARQYWQNRAGAFGFSTDARKNLRAHLRTTIADDSAASALRANASRIAQGEFPYFNHRWEKPGNPPNFQHDPIHNVTWPTGQHWTTYGQFNPDRADLKCVWEASRFSWAYLLARAHVLDPACDAARTFWSHFEAWDQQNPYGSTAQWACGQESSFRLFAWLFAASALLDSAETTDARLARLTELVWYTGRHVAENIVYARSQKNNHAISEAAALWLIGSLFPELKAAEEWRAQGQRVLEAEVARQIYPDGSYVQHSLNYHRVMLDDLLLVLSVARRIGVAFSERLQAKFEAATRWLLDFVDPDTGVVANYGANDGALVLPLSTCDYDDFRPVARAAAHFAALPTRFERGPWDEKLFWLAGFDAVRTAEPTNPENFAESDESKTKRLGGGLAGSNENKQRSVGRRDGGYF